jgi:hypothetical protein
VTIGIISGAVGISTTSGDTDLKAVSGGDVRVQTVSGDVRIHIDRTFDLGQVPQALAHVGEGRASGKVVVENV